MRWSTEVLDKLIPDIWRSNASVVKVQCHPGGIDHFSDVDDVFDQELATSVDGLFDAGRMHGSLNPSSRWKSVWADPSVRLYWDSLRSVLVVGNNIAAWSRQRFEQPRLSG